MKLLKNILLFFFLLLVIKAKGQEIFYKTYHNLQEGLTDLIIKNDSTVYFFGQYNFCNLCPSNALIIKSDESGNFIWSYIYGEYSSIYKAVDVGDGITAFGRFNDTSIIGDHWDYNIFKIDYDGNLLWQKRYGTEYEDYGTMIKTLDNGYLIAGYSFENIPNVIDTSILNLFKLDSIGNLEWSRFYSITNGIGITSAVQLADSSFVIAGASSDSTYARAKAFLMKCNSSGNILWSKNYGDTSFIASFQNIIIGPQQQIVCSGYTYINHSDPFLAFMDTAGNITSIKQYYKPGGYDYPLSLIQQSNKKLLLTCGFGVINTDSIGNFLEAHTYIPNFPAQAAYPALSETFDKGILMAGTNTQGWDLVIVKLDSLLDGGCGMYTQNLTVVPLFFNTSILNSIVVNPNQVIGINLSRDTIIFSDSIFCETATSINNQEENKTSSPFSFFPNPAHDFLTFQINNGADLDYEITIFDLMGNIIRKITDHSNIKIDLKNFSEGVYLIKISLNKKEYYTKIIKIN